MITQPRAVIARLLYTANTVIMNPALALPFGADILMIDLDLNETGLIEAPGVRTLIASLKEMSGHVRTGGVVLRLAFAAQQARAIVDQHFREGGRNAGSEEKTTA